jgi:hypothetical protein
MGNIEGMCYRHYREKHGHPYVPVKKRGKYNQGKKNFAKSQKANKPPAQPQNKEKPRSPAGQGKTGAPRTGARISKNTGLALAADIKISTSVTLDFAGHEDLLRKILVEAQREFRPVEYQIFYNLNYLQELLEEAHSEEGGQS